MFNLKNLIVGLITLVISGVTFAHGHLEHTDNLPLLSSIPNGTYYTALAILSAAALILSLGIIFPIHRLRLSIKPVSFSHGLAGGIMIALGIASLMENLTMLGGMYFLSGFAGLYILNAAITGGGCACCNPVNDGKMTAYSVVMHNIPEYFVIFASLLQSLELGLMLVVSLVLHNLPLSISIGLSLRGISVKDKFKFFMLLTVLPVVSSLFIYSQISAFGNIDFDNLITLIGGMISYVAVFHLSGLYYVYGNKKFTVIGTLLGILITVCNVMFLDI